MNFGRSENTTMMRLTRITYGAEDTNLFEFRPLDGSTVPSFSAGAHVDLHLPSGLIRQYSIANSQADRSRYLLGVKLARNGRGGSQYMHNNLRVGSVLKVGIPRNNFPLAEDAPHSTFIAGGIGITPIYCMIDRLTQLGRPWHLYYGVRRKEEVIFQGLLAAEPTRLHLHVDEEHSNRPIDIASIVASTPRDAHIYCCGPEPMLEAFERACSDHPDDHVHLERFGSAGSAIPAATSSYTVELRRSGRTVIVEQGQSLLQALHAAGVDVPISCEQGICGTCETRVLSGAPDHHDQILSDEEKASNRSMMVCCSGCLGESLVLDL